MANWRNIITNIINTKVSKIRFDEPLTKYTTFHIGGQADCHIIINSDVDLVNVMKYTYTENIPVFILGNGSKLLISSQGLDGTTIKLGTRYNYLSRQNNEVTVGGATPLLKLVDFAQNESLSGVEFLRGIPATFGGAVKCNAGAFGKDTSSIINSLSGVSHTGQKITLQSTDLQFSYRMSNIPDNFIITEGKILLSQQDKKTISKTQHEYQKIRNHKHPWGFSVGSIFKNPVNSLLKKIPAGKLIDEVKLKGLCIGDALISKKHANFIINRKQAHSNDVYELIQVIKSKVELKFNIILEEEVQILPKNMEVKKWQNRNELSV